MVLQRLVGLALVCSVGLVGMEIVGRVEVGDKGAGGLIERVRPGSRRPKEIESIS